MRYVIVGCGRVGAELAWRLSHDGHDVAVLDQAAESFDNLHPMFRGRTIQGDVLSQDVLKQAGIALADGLAAVTNSDAVNAVAAHVARREYGIRNVVVRSYAPSWMPLHQAFGFQVVSSTTWGAQRIEQMLLHSFARSVFSAGNGEVEIYEVVAPADWDGQALGKLLEGEACLPVAVSRAGHAVLPEPDLIVRQGDLVHLSATLPGITALRARMKPDSEG